jgi:hypothetical protein
MTTNHLIILLFLWVYLGFGYWIYTYFVGLLKRQNPLIYKKLINNNFVYYLVTFIYISLWILWVAVAVLSAIKFFIKELLEKGDK